MSPPRLEFSVETDLDARWDEPRIAALVRSILERELPGSGNYAIGMHLVSNPTLRALNVEHRGKDAPTDVLSFPLLDNSDFALPPDQAVYLGDVVVSHETAIQQAHEYGHSIDREIAYLVAHGVLHILGYDHEEERERVLMRAKEEEALAPLGLTR
jgi:probable rRNA maturation factor